MKRGPKRKLSPRIEANAATLFLCGWKVHAVACQYKVDVNTVIRAMKRLGIYHSKRGLQLAQKKGELPCLVNSALPAAPLRSDSSAIATGSRSSARASALMTTG